MTDPSAATGGITAYLKGLSPKAKQYLVLGGLGTGFIGLVFGSIALWDKQPPAVPQTGLRSIRVMFGCPNHPSR